MYISGLVWLVLVLGIVGNILTANYGVKKISLQNQLQNPVLVTLKNLMRHLTARLEDGYCSINIANQRLINVIRFVTKSYTHI